MFLYLSVSHFVDGDVSQHTMGGECTPPRKTPPRQPPPRQTPRLADIPTPEMATKVGSMHPTGMNSCFYLKITAFSRKSS